jgi:hypothetical protein
VKVLKTVFAALHENDSETFSKKLKRIKTKIFIPKHLMKISDHSVARACVAQRLRGQASNNSPIERITKTPITTIWLRKSARH